MPGSSLSEWRWSTQLIKDGHVFRTSEWRCSDCLRTAYDLLTDRRPCFTYDGTKTLFVGGPWHGQYVDVGYPAPPTWMVAVPINEPSVLVDEDIPYRNSFDEVVYIKKNRADGKGPTYVYDP